MGREIGSYIRVIRVVLLPRGDGTTLSLRAERQSFLDVRRLVNAVRKAPLRSLTHFQAAVDGLAPRGHRRGVPFATNPQRAIRPKAAATRARRSLRLKPSVDFGRRRQNDRVAF